MLSMVFRKPDKFSMFFKNVINEIVKIGVSSLGLVALLSVFMGAVLVVQTASNIDSPLIKNFMIGFAARQSMILEFSSTMIALILAGKVGSNITSEIGTMRITEQIEAIEVMGVNSINYLILPKFVGGVFIFPFIVIISMGLGLIGGALSVSIAGITMQDYILGLQSYFDPFSITYSLIKSVFFWK